MPKRAFEQWIDGIFDHSVEEREWYWDPDADTCVEPDPETNVEYLARLFEESDTVVRRFSDAQVGQGFWMIGDQSCSDHAWSIVVDRAAWPARRRAIRAIFDLYEKCFNRRCTDALVSDSEKPLDLICYMWWDVFPASPGDATPRREQEEYLSVMERCLSLSNYACLEGALHGLGHWQGVIPGRVEDVIDCFMKSRDDLTLEMLDYARRARAGAVQ